VATKVVAAVAAIAACSCYDTTSMAVAHSQEATAWMVAMAADRSDGATLVATKAMVAVSKLVGAVTTMKVETSQSGESRSDRVWWIGSKALGCI
jgi:predicted nuclease with TOPRIM domain